MSSPKRNSLVVLPLTILLLAIPSLALVFNENVHRVQESGSKCVHDVAGKFFEKFSTIALVRIEREMKSNLNVGISTDDLIVQKLFNDGSWTIVMKFYSSVQAQHSPDFGFEKIHNYILMFRDLALIDRVLGQLSLTRSWNPHANFLVVIDGLVGDPQLFAQKLIDIFWRYWVINLTILVPSEKIYGHLLITWFPFEGRFSTLGVCKESRLEPPDLKCFPEKVPRDLSGTLVRVGAVHSPPFVIVRRRKEDLTPFIDLDSGIEMQILKTVAWRANFRVSLVVSYLAEGTSEGGGGGLFNELAERRFEIAIGTISPTIETHREFDFSVQYTQDIATWVVPSDDLMPQWVALLLVFQPSAYAATFALLFFFCAAASSVVKVFDWNFRTEHRIFKQPVSFLMVTVGILFANIPNKFPRTFFLKYLLVIWLFFCLHWSTAYNGTLMSVLTNTVFTSGIETEKDLLAMKMNLEITNRTFRYFKRLHEDNANEGLRMIMCLAEEQCLQGISEKRDSALAMSRIHFDFVKDKYRDEEDGLYRVKALKTNIVTAPIEMLLSKGNPLLPRINAILLDIIESGLIDYWTRNVTTEGVADKDEKFKEQKILKLANLQGVFFIWALGLALSLATFAAEFWRRGWGWRVVSGS